MVHIFHPLCYPLPCSLFGCILVLLPLVILLALITLFLCLGYRLLCIPLMLSLGILSNLLLLDLMLIPILVVLFLLSRIVQMVILLFLSFSFVLTVLGLLYSALHLGKGIPCLSSRPLTYCFRSGCLLGFLGGLRRYAVSPLLLFTFFPFTFLRSFSRGIRVGRGGEGRGSYFSSVLSRGRGFRSIVLVALSLTHFAPIPYPVGLVLPWDSLSTSSLSTLSSLFLRDFLTPISYPDLG